MNHNLPPRVNHNILSKPALRGDRRFYEGGDTIPHPQSLAEKNERLAKLRERFLRQPKIEIERTTPERFSELELGRQLSETEGELPIRAYKDQIIDSVANNQITIVTAETGGGKSTQIPQYLLEMGYNVHMTQPRRISAVFIAEEIQKQLVDVLDDKAMGLVGYHTAENNTVIEGKTRVTVLTDGLRLVQEFGQRTELKNEVLIIDEVHEWNTNIEILIARVKQLIKEKPELRVVIASATMEAEKSAEYFADGTTMPKPPIIEVPGRNYEVKKIEEPESDVVSQTLKYAEMGENILIFLPGVREIEDTMKALEAQLKERGITDATILPLHSKLSQQEQERVKSSYHGIKIICATNIAQTSITIPDINVVIDAGLERRKEIDDQGVESLNLRPVSRADMIQRAGRTGRVAPGFYIHTRLNEDQPFIPFDNNQRTDYPIAEILRTDVERNMLITASAGINFEDLELFHPVELAVIDRAKHALRMLGAMDDEGVITSRGQRMVKLPMRPRYAHMITEAEDQGFKAHVRTYVAAMVAAMEVGGMPSYLQNTSKQWRSSTEQTDSDHIAQLDLFIAAQSMIESERREIGLDIRNVERAQELYRKVCKRTQLIVDTQLVPPNEEERAQIRRTIASASVDYVYKRSGVSEYMRVSGTNAVPRTKTDRTTVMGNSELLIGFPYGIERNRRGARTVEHVVQDITVITPQLLGEVAIRHCSWENSGTQWRGGQLKRIQKQLFRGSITTGIMREIDAQPTPEIIREVKQYIIQNSGNAVKELKAIKKELETLQQLTPKRLPRLTQDDIELMIHTAIDGRIIDPEHVDYIIRETMARKNIHLDALVDRTERQIIIDSSPAEVYVGDILMRVQYRNGVPRCSIKEIQQVLTWSGELQLPDGREIELIYDRRSYSSEKLRRLATTA